MFSTVHTKQKMGITLKLLRIATIQWKLSVEDIIGNQLPVLYREVSLIHRYMCAQLYVVSTADMVLIREMFCV